MSGLQQHGIEHLSPSSLNLFAAEPALWVMERLLGHRSSPGCAAHRGTAAEAGIEIGLINPDLPVAEYTALQVKQAVVGAGKAHKTQVQMMVRKLLRLPGDPSPDAADALACAICHVRSLTLNSSPSSASVKPSWN